MNKMIVVAQISKLWVDVWSHGKERVAMNDSLFKKTECQTLSRELSAITCEPVKFKRFVTTENKSAVNM